MQKILILPAFVVMGLGAIAQVQRKMAIANETISATVHEPEGSKVGFAKKMDQRTIWKKLDLSKEQKQRIKKIQQSHQLKRDEILQDDTLGEDQKQDKLTAIKKAAALDFRAILTDEQKARMKAIRDENKKYLKTRQPEWREGE